MNGPCGEHVQFNINALLDSSTPSGLSWIFLVAHRQDLVALVGER